MVNSFIIPTLFLAALYSLIALAWVAVIQATGVFNLATGSFILIGPYFVIGLMSQGSIPLALSVIIAIMLVAATAALAYQVNLRPLAGRPLLAPVIVTLGLSIALNAIVQIVWGARNRAISNPGVLGFIPLGGGERVATFTVLAVAVAFLFVLGVMAVTRFTRIGILMRASAEHPLRAEQLGIGIHRMASLGWAISGTAAALAGMIFAFQNLATPDLALLGFKGLAPAMLGGFQSTGGALIGGLAVAVVETGAVSVWGGQVRDVVPFAVLLLILLVRPQGLFGMPTYLRV